MNCVIIEDQPPAQRILKKYIEDIGTLKLKATFTDAISALEYLRSNSVDLLFLDIHLPKMSGMDFLKTISNPPPVILTTAFADYALESYDFNVIDYLLKPFSFQRFVKGVSKIPTEAKRQEQSIVEKNIKPTQKELFIKSGHELIKIKLENVLYIKSDTDYTALFLHDKKYLSSESLRYWEEHLDKNQFARTHKSYVVNISKIEKLSGSQLHLNNKTVIPIGRVYKEGFMERIKWRL
ncbi:MAG: response regulator transcription factor [Flavobacteriales bacterium]|nr:response regulator transcription factor [Flavobacteriales bacterium]